MSESFSIKIDKAEWEAFAKKLGESDERLNRHMRNAMDGSLDYLLALITAETPVNTGALRQSFAKNITGQAMDMIGVVATPLIYGWPVEAGRAAGRMPPIDAIEYWVIRKGIASADEAHSVAFAIARHMEKNPTKGAHMVEHAFNEAVNTNTMWQVWDYELDKFLEELAQ